jgi:hypothetical protein
MALRCGKCDVAKPPSGPEGMRPQPLAARSDPETDAPKARAEPLPLAWTAHHRQAVSDHR